MPDNDIFISRFTDLDAPNVQVVYVKSEGILRCVFCKLEDTRNVDGLHFDCKNTTVMINHLQEHADKGQVVPMGDIVGKLSQIAHEVDTWDADDIEHMTAHTDEAEKKAEEIQERINKLPGREDFSWLPDSMQGAF